MTTGGAVTAVERMMQQALDQAGTGMYLIDSQRRMLFFNEVGRRLMPDPDAVAVGEDMFALNPLLPGTEFGAAVTDALARRVSTSTRAFSVRLAGWYDMSCYPAGEGVAIYCRNVSQEVETEERLEQARRRLQRKSALLDAATDAIYVRELDRSISYWNKGAERVYGWRADEVLGQRDSAVLPDDPTADADLIGRTLREEGEWVGVVEQTARDGRVLAMHCRWQLVRGDDGTPLFMLCMESDLTAFTREQDKTYRAQRMESLGTLAGGIAHDLNNMLTPVLIAAQLLQAGQHDDADQELLETIETSASHGAELIQRVLSFARGEEGERSLVETGPLLADVVDFAGDTLPKSIDVVLRADRDLWPVMGDRTQITQILVNLVTNARDAMPQGGTLTVSASNDAASAGARRGAHGDQIVLSVEDTGTGMDRDTASRVFEPFFSTKPTGSGTGLGLSTSLAIAKGHGGGMEVYSESGRGSRFCLYLPAALGAPATPPGVVRANESGHPRGDGELILVVDDDDAIRGLTGRMLEHYGYRTLEASDGREAILLIEADHSIDLVVTDMMMPVMGGAEVVAHLHRSRPGLPVIAASGLTANVEVARGDQHSVRFFLPKPYSAMELLQSVHRVFHDGGAAVGRPAPGGEGLPEG
jgi:two-component system cell cycle sensor histidine kinase/response regulator CckA